MTKKEWAIIGVLGMAVVIVFCVGGMLVFATLTPSQTQVAVSTEVVAVAGRPTDTPTPPPKVGIPAKREFNHFDPVKIEYDKFKDVTSVIYAEGRGLNASPNTIIAIFSYRGQSFKMPSKIGFTVGSTSKDWQFLRAREINFLLDDSTRFSYSVERDSKVGSGYVIEWLSVQMSVEDFLKLVNAKQVEYSILSATVSLSEQQLESLRELASYLRP